MANYDGAARTNYVRIKDMPGLVAALKPFDIDVSPSDDDPNLVCFLPGQFSDDGGFQSFATDEETDEEIEFSWEGCVCPYMQDDQILVVMGAGHEKLRYVSGWAVAYSANGSSTQIHTSDIYAKAAAFFNKPVGEISIAEY